MRRLTEIISPPLVIEIGPPPGPPPPYVDTKDDPTNNNNPPDPDDPDDPEDNDDDEDEDEDVCYITQDGDSNLDIPDANGNTVSGDVGTSSNSGGNVVEGGVNGSGTGWLDDNGDLVPTPPAVEPNSNASPTSSPSATPVTPPAVSGTPATYQIWSENGESNDESFFSLAPTFMILRSISAMPMQCGRLRAMIQHRQLPLPG